MNRRQRKFFNELADLMQKHNVNMHINQSYGEFEGITWNISGDKELGFINLTPSSIRKALITGSNK